MEIKTFASALALSLLMASPAVMAMEEEKDKGVIVQPSTPSVLTTPPVTEEDTIAKPYSGLYNLWGIIGTPTSEPEQIIGQQAIEKPDSEKTTIILPRETPQNEGGWFPWSWGSTTKTPVASPTPETDTSISAPTSSEPVSSPSVVTPEPEKEDVPTSTAAPEVSPDHWLTQSLAADLDVTKLRALLDSARNPEDDDAKAKAKAAADEIHEKALQKKQEKVQTPEAPTPATPLSGEEKSLLNRLWGYLGY
ncbi:MAG: hypothetical protein BGO67_06435 [Alphaproteobacteria bacterium 41-28]|nr:MAG: hypothetical protein BGO67_06435 [Alphaproteobacteria bacterium 41-28]